MQRKKELLIIGNVIAVFATIIVNALANIIPIGGNYTGDLSDKIPNLFVPTGLTFAIWGVIYVLLIFFAVYQLADLIGKIKTESNYIEKISFWFILASIGNIIWIFLWHYEQVILSILPMLLLFVSLLFIYIRLQIGTSDVSKHERYFIHLPISIYIGWITVATIANVTAVLVTLNVGGLILGEVLWTILVIIVAMIITLLVLYQKHDIGYSLVILWALLGIVIKRINTHESIATTAVICMIIIAAFAMFQLIKTKQFI
jgi:hypothetical protein